MRNSGKSKKSPDGNNETYELSQNFGNEYYGSTENF